MTFSTIAVLAINASFIAESRRTNVQSNAQILSEQFMPESSNVAQFLNLTAKRITLAGTGGIPTTSSSI
jgi:hypothetical protein